MKRIICVGNRYIFQDAAGPKVYDRLQKYILPDDVDVIDGGLAGLDLIRLLEGAERVVFVDGVTGFCQSKVAKHDPADRIVILGVGEVAATANRLFDHSNGLAYLLRILPAVCEGVVPQMLLVGIEGQPDQRVVDEAATLAIQVAVGGATRDVKRSRQDNTPSGGAA